MTLEGVDFGRLSLQDALDLAILIEEEAQERYEEFAAQMEVHHTPEAARFFRFMAGNEAKHGEELARRRFQLFGGATRQVSRRLLFDVEAPDYDEARAFMTPRAAMEAAWRAETKAHAFFQAALPQVHDSAVRQLFQELRDEEVVHQNLVRMEMAKLPPDDEVAPDAFVDEPTAL